MFTTSDAVQTSRYDRIGSFGKIGWQGQMLEPFEMAVKVDYFAVSS